MQQVWEQPLLEQAGFVHIDATYWGRGAGILLAIDHHTARPLYLEFIRNECAQDYRRALESISRRGYIIRGVVVDGTRTLFSLSLNIPVQMCQYHMRQIISRYLTKRPKLLASRDLLLLIDGLSNQTCEGFNQAFQAWKSKWHDTIMRRSLLKSGKSRYRHRKLRSAIHSMRPLHGNWPAFYLLIHCIIGSYFVYLSIKNSIIFLPWHTNPRIPMSM